MTTDVEEIGTSDNTEELKSLSCYGKFSCANMFPLITFNEPDGYRNKMGRGLSALTSKERHKLRCLHIRRVHLPYPTEVRSLPARVGLDYNPRAK